jgi:uncharacterized membrane protein (DUF106 family)
MESNLEEDKKGKKEGSFMPIILISILSLAVAAYWNSLPWIKNSVHYVLDPTAGWLLNWNLTGGMLIIVLIITLITTIVQKYATDQKALRELRTEQKLLQQEMKKFEHHPEKLVELQKKSFEFIPKTYKLTSRAILFTGIPFILFSRWFYDVFTALGNPVFFGFISWFWFYLIFTLVFSGILRKWLNVV